MRLGSFAVNGTSLAEHFSRGKQYASRTQRNKGPCLRDIISVLRAGA